MRGKRVDTAASGSARRVAAGLLDALPFAPSVLTLGAIFGASTGLIGISSPAAILMSALVFSGAGQFAALPLWPQGGPVVILSTLALSLRFALITTSLAPLLAARPRWLRAALAYCVDPPTSRPSATHWSWLSSPPSAI